jgi:hypothetical protein
MLEEIKPGSDQEKAFDRIDDYGQFNNTEIRQALGMTAVETFIEKPEPSRRVSSKKKQQNKKYPRPRSKLSNRGKALADELPARDDKIAQGLVPDDPETVEISRGMIEQAIKARKQSQDTSDKS